MDRPLSGEKNFVTMNNRPTIKQTDNTEHKAKTAHQSHHGSSISFVESLKYHLSCSPNPTTNF